MGQMRWFVRGDVDGFFGLALDNLVQLLVLSELCRTVLGFPDALVYGRILPGAAVSLLVGNLFYAWQAMRLARATGRTDVCALPYGINTVSLFAHVFLVMLPAKLAAEAAGAADPAQVAWQAGLVACFGSGAIELLGSTVSERVRRSTPRAALLSTLAGIALTFIAIGFLFRAYARPVDRARHPGDHPPRLLRTGPLPRRAPGRPRGHRARDGLRLAHRARAGRSDPAGTGVPSSAPGVRSAGRRTSGWKLGHVPLGHPPDGTLRHGRLDREHRVGPGRRRRVPDAASRWR